MPFALPASVESLDPVGATVEGKTGMHHSLGNLIQLVEVYSAAP